MTLPAHLFVSHGDLFDTRDPDWSKRPPLRCGYRQPLLVSDTRPIKALQQVKAALRAGPFTDLGGYPLYFVTRDGAALSFDAVQQQFAQVCYDHLNDCSTGWRIDGAQINYENADLFCDHTGQRIPSAYAEVEEEAEA
ncbi:hypothetical protein KABACHOK_05750 [Brevundimonas phage vB_BpoS-Kabachok]|uniref:Uncharacterized protein n=2 Tax=Marchewkavirus TaxID=3425052 RepID=A0A9E7MPR8_9CAUD|nr:hypothetical protein KABACHOK_05750 [Brevundimonas phage vB_BpoS-Kabachok]USN14522.1 hypothetical protein DOMOVOI_00470 [Brevundimonas phage vB_BpoS-Domovoi]